LVHIFSKIWSSFHANSRQIFQYSDPQPSMRVKWYSGMDARLSTRLGLGQV